jgi:thiol-disulfide isomerase/thioredoxin
MNRGFAILAFAAAAYGTYGTNGTYAANTPPAGTLRWTNGESIPGDFLEATGTSATWKSPFFEDPLVLDWNVIHRVDWPVDSIPVADPFIISLRDGSSIYGDLTAISGSSVFIHATRYGDVELKRSEVLDMRRIQCGPLLLDGPTGDAGWQEIDSQQVGSRPAKRVRAAKKEAATGLAVGPGGTLQMPYWNRTATLDMQMTGSVDIEFHLHASERPSFRLSLNNGPGTELRIETWDDALVTALSNESDFNLIRKIDATERDIALRFCWDSKTRHCLVFTPAGELITDWQAPADSSSSQPGLLLQNKGHDLTLDFLRIRTWDGKLPPKVDLNRPRLEFSDGQSIDGAVTSGSAGSIQLRAGAEASGTAVPLAGVEAIIFSPDLPSPADAAATLSFADGTYLQGKISAIGNGAITLVTTFSAQPLKARLDSVRQILLHAPPAAAPPPSQATLDRLMMQRHTFHGTLVNAGDDSPRWLPAGAAAPVIPSRTIPYEIARFFPEDAHSPEIPALFYTHAGDVLPGELHGIDRSGIEFDSGITHATKLPAGSLEAIQFGASAGGIEHGVTGPAWRILKGDESKVRRSGDSLEMVPGTAIGNAVAMQNSEIRFNMALEGDLWAVRLRMFCAGENPAKSTNFLFASNGNEVNCGVESEDGQFDEPRIQAAAPAGTVAVRLVIEPGSVAIFLNGLNVGTFPVPHSSRPGAGLIIEPAGIWGNSSSAIKLSGFSMLSPPGCTTLPDVAADAKAEALTVPRFRRNDPPVHALIASNGDILRGEIEAATNTSFGFRAGMEELAVPRDRVKAVVWLGKPIDAPPPPPAQSPVQKVLDQTLMRVNFGMANLSSITGWLHNTYPDLKFKLPKKTGTMGNFLSIGGDTVGSALDKICGLFGLTYHIDENGVIVMEPAGGTTPQPTAMNEKIYWLKPGSFPANDPADKNPGDKIAAAIAAKGVPFPAGATAAWNAQTAQLTVRNTPENQAHLAQVLAPDFAGAAGSPTHWLVLTSGARLALAVDKFGKDAITGWHPLYGRCSIPTADVAIVRTSALEPSAAMKSVSDWQTVYAPEPVLPEAGGDNSAMIGKVASDFKLTLLDGSKFQLANEKGKIVVLDFWATWCGPCVRSLPGLIESMAGFAPDRVRFVGVDQDEPASVVKQFLETRGWKLSVALDDGSRVGQQYGADAIPHTVIIGPDGKIAWVKTSYTPGAEGEAAAEVNKLLAPPPPSAAP